MGGRKEAVILQPRMMNLVAMALFGTLSIFVRGIALGSLEIAFWRGVIAIAVLLVLRLVTPKSTAPIPKRQKLILLLSGMAVGIDWALLFAAYQYTSVAVATLAYYFAPVLVMVLSPILFRERITAAQAICFLTATVGLVLVIAGNADLSAASLLGIGCSLAAACFYAAVVLLNKYCTAGTGIDRALLQFTGSSLLLAILIPLRGGFGILECDLPSLGNLLIVGVVYTGLAYWLYFTSIRDLPGHQTAILSYVDPVVAIFVSALYFGEATTVWQWVGAVLILGGTALYQTLAARRPALR